MHGRIETEIHELHAFFVDWFHGRLDREGTSFDRFTTVLDAEFCMVPPGGQRIDRATLVANLRAAHGSRRSRVFDIEARLIEVRQVAPGLSVAWYEEWQTTEEGRRGRISSALFLDDATKPRGVRWLHVHETWLPGRDA